jgi:intracellular septation protein
MVYTNGKEYTIMKAIGTISSSTLKRFLLGTLLEFGPIAIFLSTFPHFHIFKATIFLMIATIVSTLLTYTVQKRLPYLALYVALLTIVFGYLTLLHHEPKFIQMRDTLYDLTCVITLLCGILMNISFLKLAFHDVIPMTMQAWNRLTYSWIVYLLGSALLNEYIRRTQSLHEWFEFKGWMAIATIVFGFAAVFLLYEKGDARDDEIAIEK